MIQRIQTIYLLLATGLSSGSIFVFNLWTEDQKALFFVFDALRSGNKLLIVMGLLFFVSAITTFVTIFLFKNRKLQFVLGRISILINFILLGILIYISQNLSGEIIISEKGIGLLIPIFSIVCIVLANRAIKRDEELVKSVDRIR
ncbi:DUF4293 domain-containing protein [Lutibacter sp.]|uniref:DUF4293 domain-containing protein n=1 Tax=Lutibacter sp. TaxID=1925666 RepID=UPI0027344F89|nr:DUF4293 domain-containing protein [Lutibacter sp.]MDP3314411.1 DUF4293 domain-containing protein [Lutibacter sp.]